MIDKKGLGLRIKMGQTDSFSDLNSRLCPHLRSLNVPVDKIWNQSDVVLSVKINRTNEQPKITFFNFD